MLPLKLVWCSYSLHRFRTCCVIARDAIASTLLFHVAATVVSVLAVAKRMGVNLSAVGIGVDFLQVVSMYVCLCCWLCGFIGGEGVTLSCLALSVGNSAHSHCPYAAKYTTRLSRFRVV